MTYAVVEIGDKYCSEDSTLMRRAMNSGSIFSFYIIVARHVMPAHLVLVCSLFSMLYDNLLTLFVLYSSS